MGKHISLQQQVEDSLQKIKSAINKDNVRFILPLLRWMADKIDLIISAEEKKAIIKICKEKKERPPQVLRCSRGEIWETYLGVNIGSEQNGVTESFSRPVLIIQNDDNNKKSPNTIIVPLSKVENRTNKNEEISHEELDSIKKNLRKTEYLLFKDSVLEGEPQLKHPSIVLCQNVREINKERLNYKVTHINENCWNDINMAIKYSLGVE